jgi:glycosyltransferase involved in cell wall biosynthesis
MNDLEGVDVMCFSHLRWNFVYQRPQHLMTRLSKKTRVFFIEEPHFDDGMHYDVIRQNENLWVIVPHLSSEMNELAVIDHQREFLSRLLVKMHVREYGAWYYTPMALQISHHLRPVVTIYDCMDELSAFKFAPQALKDLEHRLLKKADVVFTGGQSLYEAKKNQHHNIHPFPSSIDFAHFFQARTHRIEPDDQKTIPHPRFGFYGVIDERMNLNLLKEVAARVKDWHFILIGPIVKIDERELPRLHNIHYLGKKEYNQLPSYLAGWDVAIMPFALNESTRFISPTKTPEYLAGGKPVISTPIIDVIKQYSTVVHFANTADDFIQVAENDIEKSAAWLEQVDSILSENSWDMTWARMEELVVKAIKNAKNKFNIKRDLEEYV